MRRTRFARALGPFAAAACVALAADLAADGAAAASADAAAPVCVARTFPELDGNHSQFPPPAAAYNSFPPTSGVHYPLAAPWGVYREPVPQFVLVHNLEHGGIVVQFGRRVPVATVTRILVWYRANPDGIVVAPLPALGGRIVLTAWAHLLRCTDFDRRAFTRFRDAYRFRGPERLPREFMRPGQ